MDASTHLQAILKRREEYKAATKKSIRNVIALRGCLLYGLNPLAPVIDQMALAANYEARRETKHTHTCKDCGETWEQDWELR